MPARTPIPVPAKLRWREFRHRFLPLLTISATLVAVIGLWITCVEAPTVVGRALAKKASLFTPISGKILSLNVTKFQSVDKGEILALIEPIGTKNQLDALRLEIDIIRNRIDPAVEKKRNAVSYYRLKLEWLQQGVALATSKVNLQRAENELSRDKKLFTEKLISDDRFDESQKNVDALAAKVDEATNMVTELGTAIDGLQELDSLNQSDQHDKQLEVAIATQEAQLKRIKQFSKPYPLMAPIAGKITAIDRLPGEIVMDGERILAITAEESTQLIAYLKPTSNFPLEPGTPIRIQTRGKDRRQAQSQIEGVSPEWEPLSNSSDTPSAGEFPLNIGLPILLTLPQELNVKPGELVDIFESKP